MLSPVTTISAPTTDNPYPARVTTYQYDEPIIIEQVKQEEPSLEVLCNCWAFTKQLVPELPSTHTILINLSQEIGDVAVFYYPNVGLYHYAKVTWTDGSSYKIIESNYRRCKKSERELTLDYPYLIGFYDII